VHDDPMPHDRQTPARRDHLEPARRPVASGSAAILSPDCEAGKHRACSGDAWDVAVDEPRRCECSCHGTPQVLVRGD
jgi:hypothetical protein